MCIFVGLQYSLFSSIDLISLLLFVKSYQFLFCYFFCSFWCPFLVPLATNPFGVYDIVNHLQDMGLNAEEEEVLQVSSVDI